jgi:pimeloyl-ACP methyl ester carboxylesterase
MGEAFVTTDGVELGYVRQGQGQGQGQGSGPPLVLVHGGATDKGCFDPIAPLLAERHEVVAYDRRGRGTSGDGHAGYEIQRELLDLAEFAAFVGGGEPVDVFGYSFGGLIAVALAAAPGASRTIRRLAVYEPPFRVPGMLPEGLRAEAASLGDPDEILRRFITRTFLLPDTVVDAMQRHPAWESSRQAVPTLDREFDVVETLAPPDKLDPAIPVLHLLGHPDCGGNPAFAAVAQRISAASDNVRIEYVSGLPHFAIATDAAHMADLIEQFLGADS